MREQRKGARPNPGGYDIEEGGIKKENQRGSKHTDK